jgi:hypothetical protein
MRNLGPYAEQMGERGVSEQLRRRRLDRQDVIGFILGIVLIVTCPAGCTIKKGYFYHPNKTTAEKQADYAQCMYYLDASFSRYGTVSSPGAETWGSDSQAEIAEAVERCMKSKGYRIISEKQAKELGVNTEEPWPPHAKTSSSTGP